MSIKLNPRKRDFLADTEPLWVSSPLALPRYCWKCTKILWRDRDRLCRKGNWSI